MKLRDEHVASGIGSTADKCMCFIIITTTNISSSCVNSFGLDGPKPISSLAFLTF